MSNRKSISQNITGSLPFLKTVEQMARYSGLGINKIRSLLEKGELEYVPNGNRKLIADCAINDWYERNKMKGGCNCGN
ncbi:DNA-binding protein [Oscillospiraceae bacterium OttesenSCG-928-G22]|nr:DNA-binding protein [Oscillospiraceae bacterium OttesenSCG-928-G22]